MDRSERSPVPLDPEARRQLLLTRIAYEREALRRDIARVKAASTPAQLLRTALGVRLKPGLFSGARSAAGPDGWFSTALAWLRRYRMVSTLVGTVFGSAAPMLKRGGGLRRIVMLAASAAAAFAAFQAWQRTRRDDEGGGV